MKGRAILVVDDDPFIRKVITKFLETAGFQPMAVGDSQKALELFAARSFDLVITDYEMPVMTGVELARRMRTLKDSIPIFLVTGSADRMDPSELDTFDGLLTKPFQQNELTSMVAAALPEEDRAGGIVARPPRYPVDWRVDCIPLEASSLARKEAVQKPATLHDVSEHGLAFVTDEALASERFCAFLIYPPSSDTPSLMVGEVRWTRDHDGKKLSGTRSLFWGSEREKASVMERAM